MGPDETDDEATGSQAAADRQGVLDQLIEEMLPNVPFDGWSRRSVHGAADAIEMERSYADALLSRLPEDALAAFSDWADRRMLEAWGELAADAADLHLRERVVRLALLRLDLLEPYKDAVRRGAALLALPQNAGLAARLLGRTVDRLWHAAGDRSSDFSYYTKRLTLGAALSATTLFWLNDTSDDQQATAAFLDRRIDGLLRTGRLVSRFGRLGSLAEAPFRLAARLKAQVGGSAGAAKGQADPAA